MLFLSTRSQKFLKKVRCLYSHLPVLLVDVISQNIFLLKERMPNLSVQKPNRLRDPWSFLEIVFVGQCEVFVCLRFV